MENSQQNVCFVTQIIIIENIHQSQIDKKGNNDTNGIPGEKKLSPQEAPVK